MKNNPRNRRRKNIVEEKTKLNYYYLYNNVEHQVIVSDHVNDDG